MDCFGNWPDILEIWALQSLALSNGNKTTAACISPPFHCLFDFVQLQQSVHATKISEPKEGEIKISSPAHIKERTEKSLQSCAQRPC